MKKNIYKNLGFTLMELILVSVIAGLIAGFALPNYGKALNRSDERVIANNLLLIREGLRMHYARYGAYPTTNYANIGEINEAFDLKIIGGDTSYICTFGSTGTWFNCYGISPAGWSLHIEMWAAGRVHCYTGSCPTCSYTTCNIND